MSEEITPAQILEALNDKADRDLMNVATGADVVVEYQMPNVNNNYTWYRKYASGWVEQGGVVDYGSQVTDIPKIQVNLPVTMADNRYYVTEMPVRNDMDGQANGLCTAYLGVFDRHTTYFCARAYCGNTNERLQLIQWEVKGMTTIPTTNTTTLFFSTSGVPVIDSYTIDGNTYTSSASVVLTNNVSYTLSAVCHGDRLKVNSTLIALMFGGSEPWSLSCTVITDGTNVTFTGNNTSIYTTTVSTPIVLTSELNCCIPYYTEVNYFDGTTKLAEEVKIGDKLLGYNENTNKFEEVEVLRVIHKIRNQLVTVTTENHEIEITPDHPILTDEGWAVYDLNADNYNTIEKIQLTENLKVLTLDGYEQIISISYRELDEAIDMYTFDVTDPIDTYVAAGIISHNEKC